MKPVELPRLSEHVFAVAVTSADLQRIGVVFAASIGGAMLSQSAINGHPLTIIDYDLQSVGGAIFETWLPTVFSRLDRYARQCRSIQSKHSGLWIESRGIGGAILEVCAQRQHSVSNLDNLPERKRLAGTLIERVSAVESRLHGGRHVKIGVTAFDNHVFEGVTTNHLLAQIVGYRPAIAEELKTELLEALCIAIHITAE